MTDEHALIGGRGGQLQLIDAATVHTIRQMNGHKNEINCIVYCAELSRVITGSDNKTACVWNVATGKCVHKLKGHSRHVTCAAVHGTMYVNSTGVAHKFASFRVLPFYDCFYAKCKNKSACIDRFL